MSISTSPEYHSRWKQDLREQERRCMRFTSEAGNLGGAAKAGGIVANGRIPGKVNSIPEEARLFLRPTRCIPRIATDVSCDDKGDDFFETALERVGAIHRGRSTGEILRVLPHWRKLTDAAIAVRWAHWLAVWSVCDESDLVSAVLALGESSVESEVECVLYR